MIISDFTVPELEALESSCNFTQDELTLFRMRSHNIPLEKCAEEMNLSLSAVKRKSQKLNTKISKVLNL